MLLYRGCPRELADAAVLALARHVPADVEVGIVFAASLVAEVGVTGVGLHSRQGGWVVTDREVQRIRRLDSELDEIWDTNPPGIFDFTTYRNGSQISHVERTIEGPSA